MSEAEISFAPKDNPYLLGHEEAEKIFLDAWKNNSLHQAWLISGPKGIGKATFAYKVARFLLWADEGRRNDYNSLDVPVDGEVFKQISNGSQSDFKLLERGYLKTEKQKIIKAIKDGNYMSDEELGELKKSSIIAVDDVRVVNEFLAKNLPMLLIPLSKKCSRGDQIENAKLFSSLGIAKMIEEEEFSNEKLLDCLDDIVKHQEKYIKNMKNISSNNASKKIAKIIKENLK